MGLEGTYVPPAGLSPNPVLLVGEAPGRHEAQQGKPFVGPAGKEQDRYLAQHGATVHYWRRTNVIPIYIEGNPDPTADLIRQWTPHLEAEIAECQPKIVLAVGAFATRWFLGNCALDLVHGVAHYAGAFDRRLVDRAGGAVVVPIMHPAAGLYNPEAKPTIARDYGCAVKMVVKVKGGGVVAVAEDEFVGAEKYTDVSGKQLRDILG